MDDVYRAVNQLSQKLIFFVFTWCLYTNIIVFVYDFVHYFFWILYEHTTLRHCDQHKLFLKGALIFLAIKLVAISMYTLAKKEYLSCYKLKKDSLETFEVIFLFVLLLCSINRSTLSQDKSDTVNITLNSLSWDTFLGYKIWGGT